MFKQWYLLVGASASCMRRVKWLRVRLAWGRWDKIASSDVFSYLASYPIVNKLCTSSGMDNCEGKGNCRSRKGITWRQWNFIWFSSCKGFILISWFQILYIWRKRIWLGVGNDRFEVEIFKFGLFVVLIFLFRSLPCCIKPTVMITNAMNSFSLLVTCSWIYNTRVGVKVEQKKHRILNILSIRFGFYTNSLFLIKKKKVQHFESLCLKKVNLIALDLKDDSEGLYVGHWFCYIYT